MTGHRNSARCNAIPRQGPIPRKTLVVPKEPFTIESTGSARDSIVILNRAKVGFHFRTFQLKG